MLYNPRKALLQILPIWTFIRIWASNQDPRFRTLSKGLMRVSPMIIDSIDVFSSCWRVPIIKNSVFASLIIKRLVINQERTSAIHFSITETALISEWIGRCASHRAVFGCTISVPSKFYSQVIVVYLWKAGRVRTLTVFVCFDFLFCLCWFVCCCLLFLYGDICGFHLTHRHASKKIKSSTIQ